MRLCFYGSASDTIDEKFKQEMFELGKTLGTEHHSLVFGGGATGLMGAIARGFHEANAMITGVAPKWMSSFEPIFQDCRTTILTEDMSDRKKMMESLSDAFIIMPGGVGTLDEFFQALVLIDLRQIDAKIILFNSDGFYDDIVKFIYAKAETGVIRQTAIDALIVCNTTEDILKNIRRLAEER